MAEQFVKSPTSERDQDLDEAISEAAHSIGWTMEQQQQTMKLARLARQARNETEVWKNNWDQANGENARWRQRLEEEKVHSAQLLEERDRAHTFLFRLLQSDVLVGNADEEYWRAEVEKAMEVPD